MKKNQLLTLFILLVFVSCNVDSQKKSTAKWKNEILKTEQEFNDYAQKEGIPKAFLAFAAAEAVLMRNDSLIVGKSAIANYFNQKKTESSQASLVWKPDFVEVAASGDLGYTYGKYTYTSTDSTGNERVYTGVFHTVWRKQSNGQWRFVWD
ncbi:MAG: nuclear transport factor 2 family protein [Bacteroidales bacterium]|nr:nuclear transport factor 2 family protein [Bacteroidales bacterium]